MRLGLALLSKLTPYPDRDRLKTPNHQTQRMPLPHEPQPKKRNHYVWKMHLARWANDGKNVWRTTETGKVSQHGVIGLARSDHFYRAAPLSERQIAFVIRTIEAGSGPAQDFHRYLLENWLLIQRAKERLSSSRIHEKSASKTVETLECNFIEDLYTAHELKVRPVLDRLSQDDLTVIEDTQSLLSLCGYVGHVSMRTKWMRDTLTTVRSTSMKPTDAQDIKNTWWFLSFVYGSNLGQSLMRTVDRTKLAILRTNQDAPFIITDNPAVNIHPDVKQRPNDIEGFDYFMPISPLRALVLCESGRYSGGTQNVAPEDVHSLNTALAERSEHIFGNEQAVVERYKRLSGSFRAFTAKRGTDTATS